MKLPALLQLPTNLPDLTDAALDYAAEQPPGHGQWVEIAPDIYWLRMPLPFALNHINLWLLRDEIDGRSGFTLVDTGIHDGPTQTLWMQLFNGVMQGLPILRVICTHMHPDHFGLSDWLCEKFSARLWMTAAEYAVGRIMSAALPGANVAGALAHFARHGVVDPASQAQLHSRGAYFTRYVPAAPHTFQRLRHGDDLQIGAQRWQVMVGYGHSPEHASLYCPERDLLIAGDMLLPRISTNLAVFALEPEADPIPLFLNSLQSYRPLPANTLVLPSHGLPFRGIAQRVTQLEVHHALRLREVLAHCQQQLSARDLVPLLFTRTLDVHQLTFALGEALAHLHCLRNLGLLHSEVGQDGIVRFQRSAASPAAVDNWLQKADNT